VELKVEASSPLPVMGNRELVSQALANLVDNATKYARSSPDGSARIIVSAGGDNGHVLLTVADNGPGIPAADRARVVERFVRLETSRTEPGSGLGLSLASAVARLHGGELRLEDNAPGLKVTIVLPRWGTTESSA
jgi:signal transduction histidine kinase